MEVTTTWYLVLAAALFTTGTVGVLIRRNPLVLFMCVELMLNAVTLTFVAFGSALGGLSGQMAVFFALVAPRHRIIFRNRVFAKIFHLCFLTVFPCNVPLVVAG